jgi:hypothetical protein
LKGVGGGAFLFTAPGQLIMGRNCKYISMHMATRTDGLGENWEEDKQQKNLVVQVSDADGLSHVILFIHKAPKKFKVWLKDYGNS